MHEGCSRLRPVAPQQLPLQQQQHSTAEWEVQLVLPNPLAQTCQQKTANLQVYQAGREQSAIE